MPQRRSTTLAKPHGRYSKILKHSRFRDRHERWMVLPMIWQNRSARPVASHSRHTGTHGRARACTCWRPHQFDSDIVAHDDLNRVDRTRHARSRREPSSVGSRPFVLRAECCKLGKDFCDGPSSQRLDNRRPTVATPASGPSSKAWSPVSRSYSTCPN